MTAIRVVEASGSNGEVQFASGSGVFGADARFKFDADAVRLELTGTVAAADGLRGSLTRLVDGTSYLIAGSNVTITSASNGQVTITSTGGGGGSDVGWIGRSSGQIDTTGSVGITGSLHLGQSIKLIGETSNKIDFQSGQVLILSGGAPISPDEASGTDVTFFVSGTDGGKSAGTGMSVFGGDVQLSGALYLGNSSQYAVAQVVDGLNQLIIDGDNYVDLKADNSVKMYVGSSNVEAMVAHGTDVGAGLGIVVNDDATSTMDFRVETANKTHAIFTDASTDQVLILSGGAATSPNETTYTDTAFFVSGAIGSRDTAIKGAALFGGDVVISGALHGGSPLQVGEYRTDLGADINFFVSGALASKGTAVRGSALFGGDTVVSGAISALSGLSGSLTRLTNDTSYLVAGSNITITSASNGQVTIASTGGGGGGTVTVEQAGGSSTASVDTMVFTGSVVTDDGGGQVTIQPVIGAAEDGTYTDGLFTDFIYTTPIGTAVDKINEVLKALSPTPAPDLDDINSLDTGLSASLSFGAASPVGGYTSVGSGAGLGVAVDVNGLYTVVTASNNIRASVFALDTELTGVLNADVAPSNYSNGTTNYTTSSFGNAEIGVLRLMVNGSNIKEIDLTVGAIGDGVPGLGTGRYVNANGSGFISLSQTGSAIFENGNSLVAFQHRTGRYVVDTVDQRNGWNYVQVLHVMTGNTVTTNYVEWVNDNNSNALAATNQRWENFDLGEGLFNSGVEYYVSGTANYKVDVSNAYKTVYQYNASASYTTTNCTIPQVPIEAINTGAGEDYTKVLKLTGSATITATELFNQGLTSSVNVPHPLKSNLTAGGQVDTGGILLYTASNNSTTQLETFKRENFRLTSGSYNTQASMAAAGAVWDSTLHLSGAADQADGLIFFYQSLKSPLDNSLAGDFRNAAEGGSVAFAPDSNPNYSSLAGLRTFYRSFKNETGGTVRDMSFTIDGSGTITQQGGSLGTAGLSVLVKFPSNGTDETGWLDMSQNFALEQYDNGDGCLVGSLDSSLNATNIVTFGSQSLANNESIMLKLEANSAWTGNASQISATFGAGTGGAPVTAPDLDDTDCNNTGTGCKLSFGSSKGIAGYTDVGGGAGIGSAEDINDDYISTISGNNLRRAAFGGDSGTVAIGGDLNEDVSSNMPSYSADAFGDALNGTLNLEVNGAVVHTTLLTASFGSGVPGSGGASDLNANGSGFTNISVPTAGEYSGNNVPDYTLIYRTGRFTVATTDQREGWNYVRVQHAAPGGTTTTNYVEWVNDSNTNALGASNEILNNFSGSTFYYQSGVKYFQQCSSSYIAQVANVYKNVFSRSSSAISTTVSNLTVNAIEVNGDGVSGGSVSASSRGLPDLLSAAGSQNEDIFVTASVPFTRSSAVPGPYGTTNYTASSRITVDHPLKADETSAQKTKNNFLVHSASLTSNLYTNEYFTREDYRIQSGTYLNQAAISSGPWNSQQSMNDGGAPTYATGLLSYNGYLIPPDQGGASGDFRNLDEGGSLQSPNGNVNYSTLSVSVRDFYRKFENNTTNDVGSITVTLYGDATIVGRAGINAGTLGANKNIYVDVKIPGDTGFLDMGRPTAGSGNISDGDGGLVGSLSATVITGGTANALSFNGTALAGTISGAEQMVIRISAHEDWTGYLTRILIGY